MEFAVGVIFVLIFILNGVIFSRLSKLIASEAFKILEKIIEFFQDTFKFFRGIKKVLKNLDK